MSAQAGITAKQILDLLAERHAGDLFVPECKDGPSQYRGHLRLDAWTLLKSMDTPAELSAWVQGILSETPPEDSRDGLDKYVSDLAGEIEATWRKVFLARQCKNEVASNV